MSFGTYARKVQNPSLPYGQRVNALGGCVQRYRPIGYLATFAYLTEVAGRIRHDETALLHALDVLSSSRNLWLADLTAYASRRAEAKRAGRRTPAKAEFNPAFPPFWYGDRQRAATFALRFLLRPRSGCTADPEVVAHASAFLRTGADIPVADLRDRHIRLRDESSWPHLDWVAYERARDSLRILRHIEDAVS